MSPPGWAAKARSRRTRRPTTVSRWSRTRRELRAENGRWATVPESPAAARESSVVDEEEAMRRPEEVTAAKREATDVLGSGAGRRRRGQRVRKPGRRGPDGRRAGARGLGGRREGPPEGRRDRRPPHGERVEPRLAADPRRRSADRGDAHFSRSLGRGECHWHGWLFVGPLR